MNDTFDEPSDKPKQTALQQIHKQIERQMRPVRQLEEMQNQAKRHFSGYQLKEELARQFEPYRQIQEMLKRSAIPQHIQNVIDEASIFTQAKRMMEEYIPKNPLAGLVIDNEIIQGLAGLNESMRRAAGLDFVSDFARQVKESNSAIRAIEEAQKSLNSLLPAFRDINLEQFEASLEDKLETNHAVASITLAAPELESIQEAVDRIVIAIQAQRNPTVQLMMWLIIRKVLDWLIAGVIGAAMGHYAPIVLGESPQAAKKSIQNNAQAAVGSVEILAEFRYVSAKTLSVRQNPKARSPEIGRLSFGMAVRLLKKEKDFALVIWTDKENGAEIQGWVFSRYLGKFN